MSPAAAYFVVASPLLLCGYNLRSYVCNVPSTRPTQHLCSWMPILFVFWVSLTQADSVLNQIVSLMHDMSILSHISCTVTSSNPHY